ncbi:BatA domain-containing protein [uncultured Microscilla sp.]|uniref:BatA domain-containing protein n=1 Tax=uncultured Microscilla sp. TaxID=432653 RepID=UPI0026239A12|nr:BatA domain-containing protein [uncultured Microscilla sp.]
MNFVYPLFLWALVALAIPIAIHLFNFRKVKRVYFTNVVLLKDVKTETNSFRRVKQFLILLSRLGMVAALVLAFAQPFIPSKNQKDIQNLSGLVGMYLDNSYSMQSELGNDKYFDLASVYIADLVKVFPKDARFQLITNNFENKEQFPIPANEIADRLTETKFSNAYRSLPSLYKRQSNLLDRYSNNKKNQVFWFSDFQKSTAGDLNKVKLDTTNQYYIVPIKSEKTANIMIDSVWLENPFIKELESNRVNVRLKSFSQDNYPNLVLKLFLDGKQVSTTSAELPANATAMTSFNFTVNGKGWKAGKITFEDFPVMFDNEYFFTLNASTSINILHLHEKNPTRYIQNLYSNEKVFKLNSQNVNTLDYNRIKASDLIILNELNNIEGALVTALREFVQKGGSLVVFPAAKPGNSYGGFLGGLRVSGFKTQTLNKDSLKRTSNNTLAVPNTSNPFFKGMFNNIPRNMNMPFASAVISWNNLGNNVFTYKNRHPFMSQFGVGRGKVYLCAAPLNGDYSSLAKHAIFVPIMYKIASASKTTGERLAYTFQEKTLRLKVNNPAKNQVYKLVKDKLEIVPAQRIIGDELLLEMPAQTLEAGYYKLMLNGKQQGLIAFNYGKAESDLNYYSMEELKNTFAKAKNVQVYDFSKQGKDFITEFKAKNIQVNLWKYFIVAALAFLLIETLLIRFL